MAWTWTGFKYDPVFRFKDKEFFQTGQNQAEARFWKMRIHEEKDVRGLKSSIYLGVVEENVVTDLIFDIDSGDEDSTLQENKESALDFLSSEDGKLDVNEDVIQEDMKTEDEKKHNDNTKNANDKYLISQNEKEVDTESETK